MQFRSAALGGGVAVVLCVPLAVSVGATANDDVLISRGRPAVASSAVGPATAPAATDAVGNTRWTSADVPGSQWLPIFLGPRRRLYQGPLHWAWNYAKAHRRHASADGANWTSLYQTRAGNGGADDLKRLAGNGRYLRVLATQRGRTDG